MVGTLSIKWQEEAMQANKWRLHKTKMHKMINRKPYICIIMNYCQFITLWVKIVTHLGQRIINQLWPNLQKSNIMVYAKIFSIKM